MTTQNPQTQLIVQNRPTITRLYQKGMTVRSISNKLGVPEKTLSNYLQDWKLRGAGKSKLDPYKDWIIINYTNGELSIEEMAKKLKVTAPTLSNRLRKWGVPRNRGFYRKKTKIINDNKQQIIDWYTKEKWTTAEIAKKLRLADCTVQLKLKEWGVPARSYVKAKPEKVLELYKQGNDPLQIAKKLDTDSGTIYKTLRWKLGIKHTKKKQFSMVEDQTIRQLINNGYSVAYARELFNKFFNRKITDIVFRRRVRELDLKPTNTKRKTPRRDNTAYTKEEEEKLAEQIRRLRAQKETIIGIAGRLEVSESAVNRIIKKYNIPIDRRIFTPRVQEKMRTLYDDGMHYREIAEELCLKTESVRQELARMGIPLFQSKFNKNYTLQEEMLQNEFIKKWYNKPYLASMTKIGNKLFLDKTTVKARLEKMGIPIRSTEELKEARRSMLKKPKDPILTRTERQALGHIRLSDGKYMKKNG